ncbi:MAG: hypothetical protein LPK14_02705 [Hymenobacteraceae bacterium]|nr:hypothetical protein [Hymenobacteraceae bacterium]MDX5421136.1 hypothetical protein [Hymenobacteraceae bacterium]
MSKAVLYLFALAGLVYFLFYPFLRRSIDRKKFLKWFFVVYAIALLASTINFYFLD